MEARNLLEKELLPREALSKYFLISPLSRKELARFYLTRIAASFVSSSDHIPCSRVCPQLYLGEIPFYLDPKSFVNVFSYLPGAQYKEINQHEKIIEYVDEQEGGKHRLGLAVLVEQQYKIAAFGVVKPNKHWKDKNVKHRLLPLEDYTADAAIETMLAVADDIATTIENGESVLVHCKAGKSRSAMEVIVYLALRGREESLLFADINILDLKNDIANGENYLNDYTDKIKKHVTLVEKYLQKNRPQVELLEPQYKKAVEAIKFAKLKKALLEAGKQNEQDVIIFLQQQLQQLKPIPYSKQSTLNFDSLKNLLISDQILNAIIDFTSYTNMWIYEGENQDSDIKAFLKNIYEAKDESWYRDLINNTGPMNQLVEKVKYKSSSVTSYFMWSNAVVDEEDKKIREALREDFMRELNHYFAEHFSCTESEIKDTILNSSPTNKRVCC